MTQRKNFDRAYKLHAACRLHEAHPDQAYISFRDGFAYASNGSLTVKARLEYIADFNPQELAILEGKSIHMDNFKRLLNYRVANVTERGFEVNDQGKRVLIYFNDQMEISFTTEVNDFLERILLTDNIVSVHRVGIRASQIRIAQAVIGSDNLKADFYDGGDGRLVTHLYEYTDKGFPFIGVFIFDNLIDN